MVASTRARVVVGVLVLLVLASIGTYAFISAQKPAAASAAATLTIYKGAVQRAPAGSNTFSPVLSGQGLNGGDQVRTGAATAAAIRFGDGSITRLDSNTTVTVKTLTHQGSEYQTSVSQSVGKTWNKVQRLVGVAKFNVTGPNSSTAEVRGTTFVLIIEPNGDVRIDDYQGTVIFHAKAGSVTVTTGQSSTLLNGTSTPQPTTGIPAADLQDPFTIFNIAADANLDATGNGDILSVNANNTIAVAETQGAFTGGAADGNSDLSFTLDWPGSTFELKIIDPDGVEYDSVVSDQHPVTYTVPKPRAGDWGYQVHDISSEKPKENWSVVVGAIRPAKKTPNLFFRGGSNQVCDHTVVGGKVDTWSLDARDAAGAPTLTSSKLPDYGTFDSSRGTGTFKFAPPLDVAPADLPITVTAVFGGDTAPINCTEHVIPPKDASVGGTVVSGSSSVSGVQVTLTMPDSSTQIAFTDGAGDFGFSGLGAGDFTLAMTVPNGYKAGGPTSQTVTLDGKTAGAPVTFNLVPFAISLAAFPNESVGDPPCSVLNLINGVAPITWSVSSGVMPTGTGVDVYGHCNGTPTTGGTFTFTLTATDANGDRASHAYTITVFGAPSINGPAPAPAPINNLKPWDQGFANPQTLTGSGGIAPYSWSVVSGKLPTGMSIGATTGSLDGAPSDPPGTYATTIQMTDSAGAKAYRTVLVTIAPPPRFFTSNFSRTLVKGVALSDRFEFQDGVAPYSVTASGLPPGVTAAIVGTEQPGCDCGNPIRVQFAGAPSGIGDFTPVLTLHDAAGGTATLSGTLAVVATALAITTTTLPQPIVGAAYSAPVAATGGVGTGRTWYGFLPTGLTIDNSTGVVTGTPTQAGCFPNSYVAVYDASGGTSASYPMNALPAASGIAFCTTSLANGQVGNSYSDQIVAIGGTGALSWQIIPGSSNAPGIAVDQTGLLTSANIGTGAFTYQVIVQVTDVAQASARQQFSLPVYNLPDLAQTTLAPATTGTNYQAILPVAPFTLPPTYPVLTGGSLPIGLFLSDCGSGQPCIYGTPTEAGNFTFSLAGLDGFGTQSANPITYTLLVNTSPMAFYNPGPINMATMVGGPNFNDFQYVTGGSEPYTWQVTGALPPGIIVTPNGANASITGKATAAGTYVSTIQVTDALGASPPAPVTFTVVVDPALSITTATLPGGSAGQAYSQPIGATGGSGANYSFSLNPVCSLNGGCTYSSNLQIDPQTGVLSTIQSPTVGLEIFQVSVTDGDGNQATMDYTVYFGDPTAIVTTSLPNAARLSGYCQSLSARGGSPGYTWSLSAGSLPTGVVLDAYGHLTGTPTVAGVFTFTVSATDSVGQAATQAYTIAIS